MTLDGALQQGLPGVAVAEGEIAALGGLPPHAVKGIPHRRGLGGSVGELIVGRQEDGAVLGLDGQMLAEGHRLQPRQRPDKVDILQPGVQIFGLHLADAPGALGPGLGDIDRPRLGLKGLPGRRRFLLGRSGRIKGKGRDGAQRRRQ